jgi:hypothetical protein
MSLQERLERYKSVKEARMAAKLKEKKVGAWPSLSR